MKPLTKEKLTNIPIIDMGDLLLRPVQENDYHDVYDYAKDDEVTHFLSWDSYLSIDQAKASVQNVFLSRPSNGVPSAYAIFHKHDHKMIGTCDVFSVKWDDARGEIGYVMHKDYWNRGYMSRVLKEVIAFAFEYLHLEYLDIRHHPDNVGSRRVIEKNGFTYVGDTFFKHYDMDIPSYKMTKEDYLNTLI